ncbi:MAG: hypothetical protein ACKOAR_03690, partial [Bacteroidota bacterium]
MSKKKFKEKKERKHQPERHSLHRDVQMLLDENPGRSFEFRQIARHAGLKKKTLNRDLFDVLEALEEAGKIKQLPDGSYST